jgi:hypothetical protein
MPGSSKWSFSPGFPIKTLYVFLFSPILATCYIFGLIIRIMLNNNSNNNNNNFYIKSKIYMF